MTLKEFEALLAIEGNFMRVWPFTSGLWIAEVNGNKQDTPLEYVVGEDRDGAVSLLMTTYYANN